MKRRMLVIIAGLLELLYMLFVLALGAAILAAAVYVIRSIGK